MNQTAATSRRHRTARTLRRFVAPVAVLLVGAAISTYLVRTPPKAARRPALATARLVEVEVVRLGSHATSVEAMGTVVPARRVELRPQVGGRIVEVSPELVPGGRFAAGEVVLRIERVDYELAVAQREGELAEARAGLALEVGNQEVAQRELELLGQEVPPDERDLVLRKPQLETARAAVKRAQAALDLARLDLERTVVRAPFAALVEERGVEVGARVDTATLLATLAGTDEYWIEAAVPVGQLRWISIPGTAAEPGSEARVFDEAAWGDDVSRRGKVVRLHGGLESEGRLARILVAVPDPLARRTTADADVPPSLLLGSYVRVDVDGHTLNDVAAIDRELLREGDRVWIMTADDTLEIRPVTVVFRGRERVLISAGLTNGERVVKTDIPAPVAGMPLRLAGEAEARDG